MGTMKKLIDTIIKEKAMGNTFQELNIQMKLVLKGIDIRKITEETEDDPELLEKIYQVANDFNVNLKQVN